MKYRACKIITLAILMAVGQLASAASVNLVSESRVIQTSGNAGSGYVYLSWGEEGRIDGEFGEFNDSIEGAAQAGNNSSTGNAEILSNISEFSYTAAGNAHAMTDLSGPGSFYRGANQANSESLYDVSFELLEPMNFELLGFVALVLANENDSFGSAQVKLINEGDGFEQIFGGIGLRAGFQEDISVAGVLLAGNYRLSVEAGAYTNGLASVGVEEAVGSYAIELNLTPVPIPASAWLLCSALGFLGWKGRRKNAA